VSLPTQKRGNEDVLDGFDESSPAAGYTKQIRKRLAGYL